MIKMNKSIPYSALLLASGLCACSGADFSSSNSGASDSNHAGQQQTAMGGGEGQNQTGSGNSGGLLNTNGCIARPAGSIAVSSSPVGGYGTRNTFYHRNVAINQTGSLPDKATTTPGYKPIAISPNSELASTDFTMSSGAFAQMIENKASELEYIIFAHQFGSGLDRISIALHTKNKDYNDTTASPNVYSAYAYVSVKNIKIVNGSPVGDISIYSFSYDPNGKDALNQLISKSNPTVQDGTAIIAPASGVTTAKVSEIGASLEDFRLNIKIGADLYDSVQYRAIRANIWSENSMQMDFCK